MSGGAASAAIPAGTKKMMQSLKEIVSSTEQEIYAMLKECNMDPNEAVNRLISQESFHEVKKKREKKKEAKETLDSRSQRGSSSSSHGDRGGTGGGRTNSTQITSNENGSARGRPLQKKENGQNIAPPSLSSGSVIEVSNSSWGSAPMRTSDLIGDSVQSNPLADSFPLPSQPSSTFQHNRLGMCGHLSMADIVKMGKPQGKPSGANGLPTVASRSYSSHNVAMVNSSYDSAKHSRTANAQLQMNQESQSSQDFVVRGVEISHEPGTGVGQHTSLGEWSLIDPPPPGSGQIVSEISGASSIYPHPPELSILRVGDDSHPSSHSDDIQVVEGDVNGGNLPTNFIRSASTTDGQIEVDSYGGEYFLDDESLNNTSSYQSPRHSYVHHEVEETNPELSSTAANLQHLSLHEEQDGKSTAASPAVIIPDHLQVTNVDFSGLSFGSFGTGISASFSGAFTSMPLRSNLTMPPISDASSVDPSDARESEYYDNERLHSTADDNIDPSSDAKNASFGMGSASQPEVSRDDKLDATHVLRHNIPTASVHAFSSTTQADAGSHSYAQSNIQIQNLVSSDVMQPYNISLPSNFLPPAAQPFRETDLPRLPLFSTNHSIPVSSSSVPSMTEAVNQGTFSIPQSSGPTASPGALQHLLAANPYSQSSLPSGHFTNMMGYPLPPPQGFAYVPPAAAFQQSYSANSVFHQSPLALNNAGMKYTVPQYKSSLPLASGYNSEGYEEALRSHYKEGHHLVSVPQSENSPLWLQGASSRTMQTLQPNTYYNSYQAQNQRQPSHLGALGYQNLYRLHAEQQLSEGNLDGSEGSRLSQYSYR